MSGILQNAKSKLLGRDTREHSPVIDEFSELPTLADLLIPGTGYTFTDEFACLLRLVGEGRKQA